MKGGNAVQLIGSQGVDHTRQHLYIASEIRITEPESKFQRLTRSCAHVRYKYYVVLQLVELRKKACGDKFKRQNSIK